MLKPLNNNIILKEVSEKKKFKGIVIPPQVTANQVIFAKVIALPKKPLETQDLKVGDYVVLGYSPVWEKRYKHKIDNEDYLIVNEYAILAIVNNDLLDLVNTEDNTL